jgi:hypothetical protein
MTYYITGCLIQTWFIPILIVAFFFSTNLTSRTYGTKERTNLTMGDIMIYIYIFNIIYIYILYIILHIWGNYDEHAAL